MADEKKTSNLNESAQLKALAVDLQRGTFSAQPRAAEPLKKSFQSVASRPVNDPSKAGASTQPKAVPPTQSTKPPSPSED